MSSPGSRRTASRIQRFFAQQGSVIQRSIWLVLVLLATRNRRSGCRCRWTATGWRCCRTWNLTVHCARCYQVRCGPENRRYRPGESRAAYVPSTRRCHRARESSAIWRTSWKGARQHLSVKSSRRKSVHGFPASRNVWIRICDSGRSFLGIARCQPGHGTGKLACGQSRRAAG